MRPRTDPAFRRVIPMRDFHLICDTLEVNEPSRVKGVSLFRDRES